MRLACLLLLLPAFLRAEPPFYPDKAKLLEWRDADGKPNEVKTPADWAKRRAHILEGMQLAMGKLPDEKRKVPLDIQETEKAEAKLFWRKKITFAAEKGDRVPAYLFIPKDLDGKKAPAMLALHQTIAIGKGEPSGFGGSVNLRYAVELASRGYVVLAPDYPSFGDYKFDFAKSDFQSGSMKAIWNNMCAVDLLCSLPEVDAGRIGCVGHSLGGQNTMFTMAFDTRIKAGVSSCGFTSFPKYYGGKLKGWSSNRYMPFVDSKYKNDPKKMPFDFPEVVASFAPRAFFACAPVGDDNFEVSGVKDCVAAATPVYELLKAKDKLKAIYPDCKHDFPEKAREEAYEWLGRQLKGK